MTVRHFDDLDLKILKELQNDARASFNEIARRLGISTGTVTSRVSKLMKNGILRGIYPDVNCEKLGVKVTVFGLIKVNPNYDVDTVGKQIGAIEGVKCVYAISGEYDLLILARCMLHEDVGELFEKIRRVDGVAEVIKLVSFKKLKEDYTVDFKLIEKKIGNVCF
ncbi:MAG: Lrp/AsnC family transcriptional regulator [Candidatus Asgardarchaeia archaeon]